MSKLTDLQTSLDALAAAVQARTAPNPVDVPVPFEEDPRLDGIKAQVDAAVVALTPVKVPVPPVAAPTAVVDTGTAPATTVVVGATPTTTTT